MVAENWNADSGKKANPVPLPSVWLDNTIPFQLPLREFTVFSHEKDLSADMLSVNLPFREV